MSTPGPVRRRLPATMTVATVAAVLLVGAASPSAARPVEHLDPHAAARPTVTAPRSATVATTAVATPPIPVPEPPPPAAEAPPPEPEPEPPPQPPHFAQIDNLPLLLPDGVTVVGFHEATSRQALVLQPFEAAEGASSVIMGSRGRGTAATSAVDLAMPANRPLLSPVSGTVAWASRYLLYGQHADAMVTIIPDSRPDVQVVLLHLDVVHVRAGQRVVAGETIIASTARQLPFRSQIDRYAGYGPHVHLEVRRPG